MLIAELVAQYANGVAADWLATYHSMRYTVKLQQNQQTKLCCILTQNTSTTNEYKVKHKEDSNMI
jgi:hypothetical protein